MKHHCPLLDATFLDSRTADRNAPHIGGILVFDGPAPALDEHARAQPRSGCALPRYRQRLSSRSAAVSGAPAGRTTPLRHRRPRHRAALPAPMASASCRVGRRLLLAPARPPRPLWRSVVLEGSRTGAGRSPPRPTTASSTASAPATPRNSDARRKAPTPPLAAPDAAAPAAHGVLRELASLPPPARVGSTAPAGSSSSAPRRAGAAPHTSLNADRRAPAAPRVPIDLGASTRSATRSAGRSTTSCSRS